MNAARRHAGYGDVRQLRVVFCFSGKDKIGDPESDTYELIAAT